MSEMDTYHSIEIDSVVLGYGDNILVEESTFGFGKGHFTALLGRNGTGKSTLLRAIAGLQKPLSGEIRIENRNVMDIPRRDIATKISLVTTEEIRVENLSVKDIVGLGRTPYTNWIGTFTDKDKYIINRSLSLVGMAEFGNRWIQRLSDGERQRVMIARALAQDTDIILLDEPTAFLDVSNKYDICLLLRKLARDENKCIICSTHDLNVALELCDQVTLIADKRFYHGATDAIIENGTIQRLFDGTNIVFDSGMRNIRLKQ